MSSDRSLKSGMDMNENSLPDSMPTLYSQQAHSVPVYSGSVGYQPSSGTSPEMPRLTPVYQRPHHPAFTVPSHPGHVQGYSYPAETQTQGYNYQAQSVSYTTLPQHVSSIRNLQYYSSTGPPRTNIPLQSAPTSTNKLERLGNDAKFMLLTQFGCGAALADDLSKKFVKFAQESLATGGQGLYHIPPGITAQHPQIPHTCSLPTTSVNNNVPRVPFVPSFSLPNLNRQHLAQQDFRHQHRNHFATRPTSNVSLTSTQMGIGHNPRTSYTGVPSPACTTLSSAPTVRSETSAIHTDAPVAVTMATTNGTYMYHDTLIARNASYGNITSSSPKATTSQTTITGKTEDGNSVPVKKDLYPDPVKDNNMGYALGTVPIIISPVGKQVTSEQPDTIKQNAVAPLIPAEFTPTTIDVLPSFNTGNLTSSSCPSTASYTTSTPNRPGSLSNESDRSPTRPRPISSISDSDTALSDTLHSATSVDSSTVDGLYANQQSSKFTGYWTGGFESAPLGQHVMGETSCNDSFHPLIDNVFSLADTKEPNLIGSVAILDQNADIHKPGPGGDYKGKSKLKKLLSHGIYTTPVKGLKHDHSYSTKTQSDTVPQGPSPADAAFPTRPRSPLTFDGWVSISCSSDEDETDDLSISRRENAKIMKVQKIEDAMQTTNALETTTFPTRDNAEPARSYPPPTKTAIKAKRCVLKKKRSVPKKSSVPIKGDEVPDSTHVALDKHDAVPNTSATIGVTRGEVSKISVKVVDRHDKEPGAAVDVPAVVQYSDTTDLALNKTEDPALSTGDIKSTEASGTLITAKPAKPKSDADSNTGAKNEDDSKFSSTTEADYRNAAKIDSDSKPAAKSEAYSSSSSGSAPVSISLSAPDTKSDTVITVCSRSTCTTSCLCTANEAILGALAAAPNNVIGKELKELTKKSGSTKKKTDANPTKGKSKAAPKQKKKCSVTKKSDTPDQKAKQINSNQSAKKTSQKNPKPSKAKNTKSTKSKPLVSVPSQMTNVKAGSDPPKPVKPAVKVCTQTVKRSDKAKTKTVKKAVKVTNNSDVPALSPMTSSSAVGEGKPTTTINAETSTKILPQQTKHIPSTVFDLNTGAVDGAAQEREFYRQLPFLQCEKLTTKENKKTQNDKTQNKKTQKNVDMAGKSSLANPSSNKSYKSSITTHKSSHPRNIKDYKCIVHNNDHSSESTLKTLRRTDSQPAGEGSESTVSKLSEKSTVSKLSEKSTVSKLSEKSTGSKLSEKSTGSKLSEKSTGSKLSEKSIGSKSSEKPTVSKLSEKSTGSKPDDTKENAPTVNDKPKMSSGMKDSGKRPSTTETTSVKRRKTSSDEDEKSGSTENTDFTRSSSSEKRRDADKDGSSRSTSVTSRRISQSATSKDINDKYGPSPSSRRVSVSEFTDSKDRHSSRSRDYRGSSRVSRISVRIPGRESVRREKERGHRRSGPSACSRRTKSPTRGARRSRSPVHRARRSRSPVRSLSTNTSRSPVQRPRYSAYGEYRRPRRMERSSRELYRGPTDRRPYWSPGKDTDRPRDDLRPRYTSTERTVVYRDSERYDGNRQINTEESLDRSIGRYRSLSARTLYRGELPDRDTKHREASMGKTEEPSPDIRPPRRDSDYQEFRDSQGRRHFVNNDRDKSRGPRSWGGSQRTTTMQNRTCIYRTNPDGRCNLENLDCRPTTPPDLAPRRLPDLGPKSSTCPPSGGVSDYNPQREGITRHDDVIRGYGVPGDKSSIENQRNHRSRHDGLLPTPPGHYSNMDQADVEQLYSQVQQAGLLGPGPAHGITPTVFLPQNTGNQWWLH